MSNKSSLRKQRRCRLKIVRLLENQVPQAEVARRRGVSRQTVSRWAEKWATGGVAVMRARVADFAQLAHAECSCAHRFSIAALAVRERLSGQ